MPCLRRGLGGRAGRLRLALVLMRRRVPGRAAASDRPCAGAGRIRWLVVVQDALGLWPHGRSLKIIFATPGLVLATTFVTFPFVARELIPVMEAIGDEEELAAISLGASGWQMFWRVTLPNIKWGLLYGVILCNARAMGEFGAVYVVSGHIAGKTDTMPLRVEKLYQEYNLPGAFALASLLTLLAHRHAGRQGGSRATGSRSASTRRPAAAAPTGSHEHSSRRHLAGVRRFIALDDVSFTVADGELVALLGPSGSRQDDAAAHHRRAGSRRRGVVLFDGEDATMRRAPAIGASASSSSTTRCSAT